MATQSQKALILKAAVHGLKGYLATNLAKEQFGTKYYFAGRANTIEVRFVDPGSGERDVVVIEVR